MKKATYNQSFLNAFSWEKSMSFISNWLVTAIAVAVAAWIVPGIEIVGGNVMAAAVSALVLALLNATVKPIFNFLSLPITVLTLGLFQLVLNAIILELASYFSRNIFHAGIAIESFGAALFGAIVIALVSAIVGKVI